MRIRTPAGASWATGERGRFLRASAIGAALAVLLSSPGWAPAGASTCSSGSAAATSTTPRPTRGSTAPGRCRAASSGSSGSSRTAAPTCTRARGRRCCASRSSPSPPASTAASRLLSMLLGVVVATAATDPPALARAPARARRRARRPGRPLDRRPRHLRRRRRVGAALRGEPAVGVPRGRGVGRGVVDRGHRRRRRLRARNRRGAASLWAALATTLALTSRSSVGLAGVAALAILCGGNLLARVRDARPSPDRGLARWLRPFRSLSGAPDAARSPAGARARAGRGRARRRVRRHQLDQVPHAVLDPVLGAGVHDPRSQAPGRSSRRTTGRCSA